MPFTLRRRGVFAPSRRIEGPVLSASKGERIRKRIYEMLY